MKLESQAEHLLGGIETAFTLAVEDTRDRARDIASRHDRTGRFSGSIQRSDIVGTSDGFEATIGSALSSARAKEKGAFIQARRGRYLVFDAGQGVRKVENVRLRPQPAVTPAGRAFSEPMTRRLQEQLGAGR